MRLLAAALAVVLTIALPPHAFGASQESLAETEVFGFLPYWELARSDGIDLDVLTTLAWFGVEVGDDGRLVRETVDGEPTPGWAGWMSDELTALRFRAAAAGVRVVLTVERFAWSTAGRRTTTKLLSDPAAQTRLAREIVEVVTAAEADGVNLDFEPLPKRVRGGFVRLVRKVRRALDAVDPSLQLTFDLTPDVGSFPLRRLVAEGAADAAVLMGYEYRTRASKVAGSVAPLRYSDGLDVRESVKRALSLAPAERVILALPWYGRAWSTRTPEVGSPTRRGDRFVAPSTTFYRDSVSRAAVAGRRYDRGQAAAWSVYRARACETCPDAWRQLWYDDVDSILAKVGLARRRTLRGVGVWALGYEGDRAELWSALRFGLERPRDDERPAGTATVDPTSIIGERDGSPLVGETVTLQLAATDTPGGSGVAFVRVGRHGRLAADGSLRDGTTFPAVDALTLAMPGVVAVDEVFVPGAATAPGPGAIVAAGEGLAVPEPVRIRVQWRDIAGNWSTPEVVRVLYVSSPKPARA